MKWLLLLPFILQAIVILVDEFYFHWRRGLPLWEKVGHPLDVCTLLGCFLWLANASYTETNLLIFAGLATFSCIFVTKEEWLHAQVCDAGEQWIHSLLFLLQPAALISAGVIWAHQTPVAATPTALEAGAAWLFPIIEIQIVLQFAFLVYQIAFWGFIRKSPKEKNATKVQKVAATKASKPSMVINTPVGNA